MEKKKLPTTTRVVPECGCRDLFGFVGINADHSHFMTFEECYTGAAHDPKVRRMTCKVEYCPVCGKKLDPQVL